MPLNDEKKSKNERRMKFSTTFLWKKEKRARILKLFDQFLSDESFQTNRDEVTTDDDVLAANLKPFLNLKLLKSQNELCLNLKMTELECLQCFSTFVADGLCQKSL